MVWCFSYGDFEHQVMQFVSHPSQLEAVVQSEQGGGPTSHYFVSTVVTTVRGGRFFSIYKNADLAGFLSYALSYICLSKWLTASKGM